MRTTAVNPRLLAAFHALQMTLFPISIMTLFWKHRIGMTMTEIFLVQGVFGLAMALFEFPSGYAADRIGYRRTLVWSAALGIFGWSIYAFAGDLLTVIVAEVVLGVAISMASGCDSALLYESLRQQERETEFGIWTGRVRFWGQSAEGTAALAAGALYVWWARGPFVLQAIVATINLAIALAMVEPARHRAPSDQHWRQIRSMLHRVFVGDRRLTAVVFLTIVLGMSSFVPVWLIPLYATDAGVPAWWIGPIWAVANYTVAIASLLSARVASALGYLPTLAICVVLVGLGYSGLAASYGVFGFAWYFALTTMRGLFGPALLHEENRLLPSSDRAGFLSLRSLLFRLSFLALGPAVGAAVERQGQHCVLALLGGALTTAAVIGWLWLRGHHRRATRERER